MSTSHTLPRLTLCAALCLSGLIGCGGSDDPSTPSITAKDQTLNPPDKLMLLEVVTMVDSFVIIREDAGGTPGALIGKVALAAGTHQGITVPLDRDGREGEMLFAIMHRDTGMAEVFEFDTDPTVDVPVTDEGGDVVKATFTVHVDGSSILPELVAEAQTADPANQVKVTRVKSPGPAFVVIHEDSAGTPGAVIGKAAVQLGETLDLSITLDRDAVDQEVLHAMLHTDDGVVGTYEFDGLSGIDDPVIDAEGEVVVRPFVVTVVPVADISVTVQDQTIEVLNQVVVREVVSDGLGFIVIHEDDAGGFGPAIGHAAVSGGTTPDVTVTLDRAVRAGERLYAMLHVDDGTLGTYEFDGENGLDAPASNLAGEIVAPPFVVSFEPRVLVQDQAVAPLDQVVIAQARLDGPGWLVVHADNAGPGEVLGQSALQHGDNDDLRVTLSRAVNNGETLYAMLHTDDGIIGTYEFDGQNGLDGPIMDSLGNTVAPPFVVSFDAAVSVADQALTVSDQVLIASVTSQGPGFVVIHEDDMGAIGAVIGFASVSNGVTSSVSVSLNRVAAQDETLYAMLHRDTGMIGVYEFAGAGSPDGPVLDDSGAVIAPAFAVQFPELQAQDQDVSPTNEVTVAAVYSVGPGFVVIHADSGGSPGAVLGSTAVPSAFSSDVVVTLSRSVLFDERLHAMLHIDAGQIGVYEPAVDLPAELDGAVVNAAFVVQFFADVMVSDQAANPANAVTVDLAVSLGPGWVVIRESFMGGPGPIIGFAALNNGSNHQVVVSLNRNVAPGETLYAALHFDAGVAGTFEYSSQGQGADQPRTNQFGSPIRTPFLITP